MHTGEKPVIQCLKKKTWEVNVRTHVVHCVEMWCSIILYCRAGLAVVSAAHHSPAAHRRAPSAEETQPL